MTSVIGAHMCVFAQIYMLVCCVSAAVSVVWRLCPHKTSTFTQNHMNMRARTHTHTHAHMLAPPPPLAHLHKTNQGRVGRDRLLIHVPQIHTPHAYVVSASDPSSGNWTHFSYDQGIDRINSNYLPYPSSLHHDYKRITTKCHILENCTTICVPA